MTAKRRSAIVAIFIVAAVTTPPDVLSQLSLAVPLLLVYEAAIWGLRRRMAARAEQPAPKPKILNPTGLTVIL
jgi:sec-independent protein translocase protein TatC